MKNFTYSTYLSPFTWRYGSSEMRTIWSEEYKRKLWRKIWVAIAKVQYKQGLLTKEELNDLIKHQQEIDIQKAFKIEQEIHHDLMAEIKVFASQAKIGGKKIHLGATSMDIEDNCDTIRYKESLATLEEKLAILLKEFRIKIQKHKNFVCMGYTHLQPAEPTTLGYRFSFYAQDLLFDFELLQFVKNRLFGKGIKGAVGTSASYVSLVGRKNTEKLEESVMQELGIKAVMISNQTSPRKLEFFVSMLLSSIAQSLYKFAFDTRIMQSPGISEWQEPFEKKQVGSSAMPFKKNPIKSEQLCSLGRLVNNLSNISKDNAQNMLLERTLDDSANRRVYLPEMFLAIDEMLSSTIKIVSGLVINEFQIKKNLELYGSFSATEKILMAIVKKQGNRQEFHEVLRVLSLKAKESIDSGGGNNLRSLLKENPYIKKYLSEKEIESLLDPTTYVGIADLLCEKLSSKIDVLLNNK